MKRIVSVLFIIMCLSLCACGSSKEISDKYNDKAAERMIREESHYLGKIAECEKYGYTDTVINQYTVTCNIESVNVVDSNDDYFTLEVKGIIYPKDDFGAALGAFKIKQKVKFDRARDKYTETIDAIDVISTTFE